MIFFIIGLISGITSGMGIGGGTILIPSLYIFANIEQHVAQSVNLIYFIPTAIVALVVHIRNKKIDFSVSIPIILFGFIGAYIGSRLAFSISGDSLKRMFGFFLLAMGIYEILRKDRKLENKK